MTIPVYIPSLGRADDRLLKSPAMQMPEKTEVYYVVPRSELGTYAVALCNYGVRARLLGCPARGIAATRLWIGEHARWKGCSKFLMADDDISFMIRKSPEDWALREAETWEVKVMLEWIEEKLDHHEHVAISPREGNNRPGIGNSDTLVIHNTRTIRALAFQTDAFLACEHGRVLVQEDFDVSLQILEKGGSNIVSYYWSQGQRMTNESGGCSTYRSHALHELSARKLADLHPGIVSLRTKENKTDAGRFGTRTEVTVQWKQAYRRGQEKNNVG